MDFFKSDEDDDILPEVKKAAAFEAAEDLTGVLLFSCDVTGVEDSGWLFDVELLFSDVGAAPEFWVTSFGVSGSGFWVTTSVL